MIHGSEEVRVMGGCTCVEVHDPRLWKDFSSLPMSVVYSAVHS
ncbi:MAG: hypothetical protein ACLUTA_16190 [Blautia wexlerae]